MYIINNNNGVYKVQAKYRNYTEQAFGYGLMLLVITAFLVLLMNSCEIKTETKSVQIKHNIMSTKVQP